MSLKDVLLVAPPLLVGLVLILRSAGDAARAGAIAKGADAYRRVHRRFLDALVRRRILSVPGVELVHSLRPWILGEAVLLVTPAIASFAGLPARRFVGALAGGLLVGAVAVMLGYRDLARREVASVRECLPMASFLLSLLLDAGMGSQAALREVTEALPRGALSRELDALARMRIIGLPRAEALDRARRRVPLEDYRAFLNLLEQGERLGVGLSSALRELSVKTLEAQGHRAETRAQQAAVKLLFPLVVFIFPAVFLVILAPVILTLVDSLS